MKITINRISQGEDEIILKYKEKNSHIQRIIDFLYEKENKLIVWKDKTQVLLKPQEILYLESVDNHTYAYTEKDVYKMDITLMAAEILMKEHGFFRCSKSMIINIYKVSALKSLSGNRIDAAMENGEHVIISRAYAVKLRRILKGEADE